MKPALPGITLALCLLTAVALPAADESVRPDLISPVSREPAVAVDLNHSGRDAIILRAERGDGLVIFLPEPGGGFSLRLFPNMGPKVTAFAVGDVNGDGNPDLVVAQQSGRVFTWIGDGAGGIEPHGWADAAWPIHLMALADLNGDRKLDAVSLNGDGGLDFLAGDGWGTFSAVDDPVKFNGGKRQAAMLALIAQSPDSALRCRTIQSWGIAGYLRITADEKSIRVLDCDRAAAPLAALHPAFPPRAVAVGDFNGDGRPDIAAISGGIRPRLQIFENQGTTSKVDAQFRPALQFRSLQPVFPSATVGVTAFSFGFSPSPANIFVGDTVQWSGIGFHTATSTPAATGCTNSGLFDSGAAASFSFTFNTVATIFYKCNPHCAIGMRSQVNVGPPSAGTVPDGRFVLGTPLMLSKPGSTGINLTWGISCSAVANNYAVYEGTLPSTGTLTGYNHAALKCSTGNSTATSVIPTGAGSHYYLVVPLTAANEGSYGENSGGTQIPPGTGACLPQALPTSC